MYLFYIDESGDKNPLVKPDEPFVMVSVCFHEYQWKKFERTINNEKLRLIQQINTRTGIRLELADAEIHSEAVRIPKKRSEHPFLKHLTHEELTQLVNVMYDQLSPRHMTIIASVIDKTRLEPFMNIDKMTKKAYELLLERGETHLAIEHDKQQAIFIIDNTTKQMNRSVAMKHSYFQREGTSSGVRLRHVVELPLFVESNLSNGVQLADLCAYNIYRTFRSGDATYPFFQRILPFICKSPRTDPGKLDGLKVFPDNHRWSDLLGRIRNERARILRENNGL
jgi:hypothetical protein